MVRILFVLWLLLGCSFLLWSNDQNNRYNTIPDQVVYSDTAYTIDYAAPKDKIETPCSPQSPCNEAFTW